VNRSTSAFLCLNPHFDSEFSQTFIPSMKLYCHQNRSRRITLKWETQNTIQNQAIRRSLKSVANLRKVAKMCFSVIETKKKPMFQVFNNFYRNKKSNLKMDKCMLKIENKRKKFGAGQNFNKWQCNKNKKKQCEQLTNFNERKNLKTSTLKKQ